MTMRMSEEFLSWAVSGGQSITSKPARRKWWRTNGNEFMSVELSWVLRRGTGLP